MKKLLVFALVLVMVLALSATVLADSFVSSPSNDDTPTVGKFEASNADWDGKIVVTSLKDSADNAEMTAAYDSIKEAAAVKDLAPSLTEEGLAVSTLFDVSATKEGAGSVTVTLTSDKFENFVALLHYVDGKWTVVENAKAEGKTLTFTVDSLSPFAVVVSTDADEPSTSEPSTSEPSTSAPSTGTSSESPETGDMVPGMIIVLAVLSGVAGVCFFAKSKENA